MQEIYIFVGMGQEIKSLKDKLSEEEYAILKKNAPWLMNIAERNLDDKIMLHRFICNLYFMPFWKRGKAIVNFLKMFDERDK